MQRLIVVCGWVELRLDRNQTLNIETINFNFAKKNRLGSFVCLFVCLFVRLVTFPVAVNHGMHRLGSSLVLKRSSIHTQHYSVPLSWGVLHVLNGMLLPRLVPLHHSNSTQWVGVKSGRTNNRDQRERTGMGNQLGWFLLESFIQTDSVGNDPSLACRSSAPLSA